MIIPSLAHSYLTTKRCKTVETSTAKLASTPRNMREQAVNGSLGLPHIQTPTRMHMRANKYKEQAFLRLRPSIDTERLDQLGLVSHEAPRLGEMTSGS